MRKVVLNINAGLTFAISYVDTSYVQDVVQNALTQDGFIINNVSASDTFNSFNIIVVCLVNDQYSDEQVRLRAQQILSNILTRTNYGVFTGSDYRLFNYVVVQIVESSSIQTTVTAQDLAAQSTLLGSLGINKDTQDALGLGLGISTPIVILVGAVLLVLYLRK